MTFNIEFIIAVIGTSIGLVSLVIAGLGFWARIYPLLQARKDRRILIQKFDRGPFDKDTIKHSTRYFIRTKCSNIDPAQEQELRHALDATHEDLFEKVDEFIKQDTPVKHLLILADSGTGKTTFVLNYYAYNARKSSKKSFQIAVVPLGHEKADKFIQEIQNPENTIIFLDAFDEDINAISDHHERIKALMDICERFRRVIITCRTQFFKKDEEIPVDTGILRIGPKKAGVKPYYEFRKVYISPFDDQDVRRYLAKRYPIWKYGLRRKALEIALKIPLLSARPMLLAHIPDLISSNVKITYTYELYDVMIEAWLERESLWADKEILREFSERLAVDIFEKRETRKMERVSYNDLKELAKIWNLEIEDWKLSGRSLLNRDAEGNFKFAHRSIMQYLYIKRLLSLKTEERGNIEFTDEMKAVLIEKIKHGSAGKNLSKVDLSQKDLSCINLIGVDFNQANLEYADFNQANLEYADFNQANLEGTNFKNVNLEYADFNQANLKGANFKSANLEHADFNKANLKGANFKSANLEYADFNKANLEGVNFKNANTDGADFRGAKLLGTIYLVVSKSIISKPIFFFEKANFEILDINYELNEFIIKTSKWPFHSKYKKILVQGFENDLDGDQLRTIEKKIEKKDVSNNLAYVIYNGNIMTDAFFQIAAYKSGNRLIIVPLKASIINEILLSEDSHYYGKLTSIEQTYLGSRNPYDLSSAIHDPTWFFGRRSEADAIIHRLESLQHAGIFGMRKIGKTTLLLQLKQLLIGKSVPIAIIKLQAGYDFDVTVLFRDIIKQIFFYIKSSGVTTMPECRSLTEPYDKISGNLFQNDLLLLWNIAKNEIGSSYMVILIDEVERLLPLNGDDIERYKLYDNFFSPIRNLSQIDKCLVSVVTAERPTIREEFGKEFISNTMFELYDERYLIFFSYDDCKDMIRNIGKLIDLTYSDNSINEIYNQTSGHPYITMIFCACLVNEIKIKQIVKVSSKDINEIVPRSIEKLHQYFRGWWINLKENEKKIITNIVNNCFNDNKICEQDIETLHHLKKQNIIHKFQEDKWQVNIRLLETWLKKRVGI